MRLVATVVVAVGCGDGVKCGDDVDVVVVVAAAAVVVDDDWAVVSLE